MRFGVVRPQTNGLVIADSCLLEAAELIEQLSNVVVRVGIVGFQGRGHIEAFEPLRLPSQGSERDPPAQVGLEKLRLKGDRPVIAREGIRMPFQLQQGVGPVAVRLGEVGLERDGAIIVGDGLVAPAEGHQAIGLVVVSRCKIPAPLDGFIETRCRLGDLAEPAEHEAAVVPGHHHARLDPEGAVIVFEGRRQTAHVSEAIGHIIMRLAGPRVQLDGPDELVDSLRHPA